MKAFDLSQRHHSTTVRVSDLRAYLTARGWSQAAFKRSQDLKFVAPADSSDSDFSLLMPSSETQSDYQDRVTTVVRALSQFEDRDAADVLRDILTPTCDKINVRLQTAEMRSGTLLLGFAAEFFDAVKNLLTFAACAERDSRTYFPKPFKEAAHFASQCRLAGTAPGSFRVTLEAPLPPPATPEQRQFFVYPPERKILLRLMRGLVEARSAHDRGDIGSLLKPGSNRLNANICDALLRMKPEADDATVDIQAVWSPSWPLSDKQKETVVTFDSRSYETIAAIGRAFREGPVMERQLWRGKIVKLAAENLLLSGGGAPTVTIRLENYPSPIRVDVKLSPEEYRKAVQAHVDGVSVEFIGVLEKSGKKAMLSDPSGFRILGLAPGFGFDYKFASGQATQNRIFSVEKVERAPRPSVPGAPLTFEDLRTALIVAVVEMTGYPDEMITLDSDLEADLGIDSIGLTSILNAIVARHPELANTKFSNVEHTKTLGDVLASLAQISGVTQSK